MKGREAPPSIGTPSINPAAAGSASTTYIQVHLWVFPALAFAQTLGFSFFEQLAPKSFLWIKPVEVGKACGCELAWLTSFPLKAMPTEPRTGSLGHHGIHSPVHTLEPTGCGGLILASVGPGFVPDSTRPPFFPADDGSQALSLPFSWRAAPVPAAILT